MEKKVDLTSIRGKEILRTREKQAKVFFFSPFMEKRLGKKRVSEQLIGLSERDLLNNEEKSWNNGSCFLRSNQRERKKERKKKSLLRPLLLLHTLTLVVNRGENCSRGI